MKDKEKQIVEELANDIYSLKSCDTSFEENCKLLAYDLVTLGWIKTNEDSVLLSREEYNETLEQFRQEIITLSQELVNSRKETAEKIFKKVKELHIEDTGEEFGYDWFGTQLIKLAKQFGVEIKHEKHY